MAVSKKDFERWLQKAKEMGATHLISVVDTFEYDDYPVYVMPSDNLNEIKKKYDNVNMQRINEVVEITNDIISPVTLYVYHVSAKNRFLTIATKEEELTNKQKEFIEKEYGEITFIENECSGFTSTVIYI